MPPACEKPISVHTLVWSKVFVQISSRKANQQANAVLCHTGERMGNSLYSRASYSCTRGLCEVDGLSTEFSFPRAKYAASVGGFCSDALRDSPVGDRGWFESGQFRTIVGVSRKGCSRTHCLGHDIAFQGTQSVE